MDTDLHYRILEPEGTEEPALTAIVIHGRGSNEEDLLGLAPHLGLPMRLVAPRGPLQISLGWSVGYAWYEFAEAGAPAPDDYTHSLKSLIGLVEEVRSTYAVPAERLVLMGFSQGAVMSIGVALHIPEQIGGVVAMSGYFPRPEGIQPPGHQLNGLPVLATHGTTDNVLPVEWGREATESLRSLGAEVSYREYPMAHEITPDSLSAVQEWLGERTVDERKGDGHR